MASSELLTAKPEILEREIAEGNVPPEVGMMLLMERISNAYPWASPQVIRGMKFRDFKCYMAINEGRAIKEATKNGS